MLKALLSLMLAVAPLLAQLAMSGHASAASRFGESVIRDHAAHAHAHDQVAGHDHADHDHASHSHAGHDHSSMSPAGHSHDGTVTPPDDGSASNHVGVKLIRSGTSPCPGGHGDHGNAGDAGCCGSYCHSVLALLAIPSASHKYGRAAFSSFAGMPTESVAPEQPHRPPSALLSL